MRAPFAYFGGKSGMAPWIASLMPAHRVYMEPFAGSLAVLLAKAPVPFEIVNDVDGALATFWRVLRDDHEQLVRVCALTPHSRAEFDSAVLDDLAGVSDIEIARRFWVRVNQSFAKTAGRRTGWSVTTARTQSVPGSIFSRLGRFAAIAERLSTVTIESCDAAGLVERLATPDTVVYCDPPYVHSARSGGFRSNDSQGGGDYRHEMTDAEHVRLAEVLRSTPATVILSGYPSDLYHELYGDWWHTDRSVTSYSSNASTAGRGRRTERLWSNRDLGGRLPFEDLA